MSEHAFLAPSSAFRWGPGGCPASPRLEALYPEDTESEASREGTAAHWYVAEILNGRHCEAGMIAPNGVPVNHEMVECGADFILDVQQTLAACTPGAFLRVEQRVTMSARVSAQNWGTPDTYIVDRGGARVHMWDFKYGHRYVDAFRNWQTIDYLIGVCETENINPVGWTFTQTIAQPRNYHPEGPMRCAPDLDGPQLVTLAGELRQAAFDAEQPDAPMKTGEYCRDCNARHACPALQHSAMSLVDISLRGAPVELTPEAVGVELAILSAAIKRMGARRTGLEEYGLGLVKAGKSIPFYKGDYSFGRERWKDETNIAEVFAIGDMYGVDLRQPIKPLTPTQAKKAGVDASVIETYSHKPRGAMALIEVTDNSIAKRFS